jgi:hypothetical protein
MPKRFTADVNLTVKQLDALCTTLADLIVDAGNGEREATAAELTMWRELFTKFYNAWGQKIVAPEVTELPYQTLDSTSPTAPRAIPLEVPQDDPHTCGHFHTEGAECPRDGAPCGDYRCCHTNFRTDRGQS